jgi:hypothetical protein
MRAIKSTTRTHAGSHDAEECIRMALTRADAIVPDSVAMAIAGWHQTPGGHGRAFAQLASTGGVDYVHIRAAIVAESMESKGTDEEITTSQDMAVLGDWVESKRL